MKNITTELVMKEAVLGIPTSLTLSILTNHRERQTRTIQAVPTRTILRIDNVSNVTHYLDDNGFWVPTWIERFLKEYEKENNRKIVDYSLDNYCYYPWVDIYDNDQNLDLIKDIPVSFIIADDCDYDGSVEDLVMSDCIDCNSIRVRIGDAPEVDLPEYFFDEVLEIANLEADEEDAVFNQEANNFPRIRNWAYGNRAKSVVIILRAN